MSQVQHELNTFTLTELKSIVRSDKKNNASLPIGNGVVIVDFQALYATDYYGQWYLIGGETTRKIIKHLYENKVQLCIVCYGDQKIANSALEVLKRDKISQMFRFILYSHYYDNKRSLLKTCREVFIPETEEKKINNTRLHNFIYLGHQPKDMKTESDLGISGVLSNCSSLNGKFKNEEQLFFGLGVAQQRFSLKKIKAIPSRDYSVHEYSVENVEEGRAQTWYSRAWDRFIGKLKKYTVDPKSPIIEGAKPVPVNLSQWLLHIFFFPSWWNNWNYEGFKSALLTAFLVTYEFDGYDCSTGEVIYSDDTRQDNEEKRYLGQYISRSLLWASFLGFPSRATAFPAETSGNGGVVPELTRLQFLSNFFLAGFDWNENTPAAKKTLQVIGFPIKFPLTFLINLITWPFKFLKNIVKLFTEMLPWLISIVLFSVLLRVLFAAHEFYQLMYQFYSIEVPMTEIAEDLLAWPKYFISKIAMILVSIPMLVASVLSLPIFALYAAFKLILVIGRAGTSPEKSMRMGFANGKSLTISSLGSSVESIISYSFGTLLGKLSISLSIALWALAFPLIFGALVWIAPLVLVQKINFILQLSAVNASFIWLQGIFLSVKPFFVSIFGTTLTTVSTIIGYDITTLGIIGIMSAIVAITMTFVIDNLSNLWSNWHDIKVVVDNNVPKISHADSIILRPDDFEVEESVATVISANKKRKSRFYEKFVDGALTAVARWFGYKSAVAEREADSAADAVDLAGRKALNGAVSNGRSSPINIELDFDSAIDHVETADRYFKN